MYRSSVPVTDDDFHDRRAELERLERLLATLRAGKPSWLAILGPRKVGKTSLLLELARRARDPSLVFVILDSFECAPLSLEIFRTLALRTADRFLAPELGLGLESLARRPADYRSLLVGAPSLARLPAALRALLLELPDRPADAALFRDALELPESLARALDRRVLVAWDEFQEVAALHGMNDPLLRLRSAWQRHRRVAYVISGSARTMLTRLVTDERSPFFQHFAVLDLGPFPHADAVRFLVEAAPRDRPVPEALARRAVAALGGHPFHLQLLGEALTACEPPYDDGSLKEALQSLLFSRTGRLALYFEGRFQTIVGRSTGLAATLAALADGPRRLADLAREIGAPTGAVVRSLERLGDAVVTTADKAYALSDPVFGLWLRWRAPGGAVVPMSVIGDEAERLVARRLAATGFDLVYQSRASRGAFDLLALRGGASLGVQVRRSALPLRFSRTEWTRMVAEAERLRWRWVVAAVAPPPGEEVLLLDPARASRGREVRLPAGSAIDNLLLWFDRR
ncbi:MAG: ATP-binding protein [Deltaproteobacteria bacterium]|nr:ATP-binding protein [Deltaproteobacteria bacterium]